MKRHKWNHANENKLIAVVSYQQLRIAWFIVLLLLLTVSSGLKAEPAFKLLSTPRQSPDFILEDLQGLKRQFSTYAGKTVVVNFWATWCGPCRREIPAMSRAWASLKDSNVVILAINVGENQETIASFKDKYPMPFTVLMDKDGTVSQRWLVTAFPTTFIVNPQGQIVYRAVGGRGWEGEDMLDNVRSIAVN